MDIKNARDNVAFRVHNVREIVMRLGQFYEEVLERELDPGFVDPMLVGREEVSKAAFVCDGTERGAC